MPTIRKVFNGRTQLHTLRCSSLNVILKGARANLPYPLPAWLFTVADSEPAMEERVESGQVPGTDWSEGSGPVEAVPAEG